MTRLSFCGADGESRTRTGLRPPPPQSGVSTISPHPLLVWICQNANFFSIIRILFNLVPIDRLRNPQQGPSDPQTSVRLKVTYDIGTESPGRVIYLSA